MQFHNPGQLLKLGMYVRRDRRPSRARTGDSGHGVFSDRHTQRRVHRSWRRLPDAHRGRTGTPHLAQLSVLKGLQAGSGSLSSANFLIDSESQLQAAAGTFVPPPPGVSAAAGQPQGKGPRASVELTTDPSPPARGKNKSDRHPEVTARHCRRAGFRYVLHGRDAFDGDGSDEGAAKLTDEGKEFTGSIDLQSGGTWQVTIAATRTARRSRRSSSTSPRPVRWRCEETR